MATRDHDCDALPFVEDATQEGMGVDDGDLLAPDTPSESSRLGFAVVSKHTYTPKLDHTP